MAELTDKYKFKRLVTQANKSYIVEVATIQNALDGGSMEQEAAEKAFKELEEGAAVDSFLYAGTDLKGQAQYAQTATGRQLSVNAAFNPLGIIGLNTIVGVEASAGKMQQLGLMVVRGPGMLEPSKSDPAPRITVPKPITLHSFSGSLWKFKLGASFEASIGWEAKYSAKTEHKEQEAADGPEDETGEKRAGETNERETNASKSDQTQAKDEAAERKLTVEPPSFETGVLNKELDRESSLEFFAVGFEAKAGVVAGITYEYESYCAYDPLPAYYDRDTATSLKGNVLDVLRFGSTKALIKERACALINEHQYYFGTIKLDGWLFRKGSDDIYQRLVFPQKQPPKTKSDLRREVYETLDILRHFLRHEAKNCVKLRIEAFAKFHPCLPGESIVDKGLRRSSAELSPELRNLQVSCKERDHEALHEELRFLRDVLVWLVEPHVKERKNTMGAHVLRTVTKNDTSYRDWLEDGKDSRPKILDFIQQQEYKERRLPEWLRCTRDAILESQDLNSTRFDACRSILMISSHEPSGEAKAFGKAEATFKVPLVANASAGVEASLSARGAYKQSLSRFQTAVVGSMAGSKDPVPVFTSHDTVIRYSTVRLEAKLAGGADVSVLGSRAEWAPDDRGNAYKPVCLNRMRYQAAIVTWMIPPGSQWKDDRVRVKALPGSGVVFGESFVVKNLQKVYERHENLSKKKVVFHRDEDSYVKMLADTLQVKPTQLWDFLCDKQVEEMLRHSELSFYPRSNGSVIIEAGFRIPPEELAEVYCKKRLVVHPAFLWGRASG